MNYFLHKKRGFLVILFFLSSLFWGDLLAQEEKEVNRKLTTVVIDPGHGGKDPGATGETAKEKNVVLDISLLVGNYIEKRCKEVEVIYTRKTDKFIPLYKRADIANKNDADLFISVHANAAENHGVNGASTFAMGLHKSERNLEVAKRENAAILKEENYKQRYEGFDPKSTESYIIFSLQQNTYLEQSLNFASYVQEKFKRKAERVNRGVRQAGFLVLWKSTMPSVLIETGFITNPKEEQFLISSNGQKSIAESIYRAFKNYKKTIESKSHFVSDSQPKNLANQQQSNNGVVYKVQILSSPKSLPQDAEEFKGIEMVDELKSGDTYKYAVGNKKAYEDALKLKKDIKKKFPGAFVIAVKNGERIPVDKALKLTVK